MHSTLPRLTPAVFYATHGAVAAGGGAGAIAIVCVCSGLALLAFMVIVRATRPTERNDDDDIDSGGGGGFGRPPGPGGDAPSGSGMTPSGPDWWPEFERAFAAHIELVQRDKIVQRERLECGVVPGAASPLRSRRKSS